MKNFAVDIDYDMVGVGYAAKNLNYIYIYMVGKRHGILQKKIIHRNY
jgi:hypothetical protein